MTSLVNDIKSVENQFVTAMGSGVSAAKHLGALIASCVASGDTRSIANVVNRLDSKSDANGSRAVRQVFGAIFTGATFAKSKDKKSIVLKLKTKEVDADALARLQDAVKNGLSIRFNLVKHVKGEAAPLAKTDAEKLAKSYIVATHKRVDGEACTLLENVTAMRMALKTLEAELAATA